MTPADIAPVLPDWTDNLRFAFSPDNPHFAGLMVATVLSFFFGYMEYIYSFLLIRREKKAPYPVWMHTFYFAHDSSWAVIMFVTASRNDWYWFFWAAGAALVVWNLFEVYNLYKVITVERQEVFGGVVAGEVTARQATFYVVMQLFAMYALVNVLISLMGPGSMMQWFLFTNMLIASAPAVVWLKRGAQTGTRYGASLGLGIIILLGTINTFHPWSMWVLSMPQVFNTPAYYYTGVVFVVIAADNLYRLAQLPAKTPTEEIPRPVW